MACAGIPCVGIAVKVDAAGDENGNQAKSRSAQKLRQGNDHSAHAAPMTAPISGKAHSAYLILRFVHANCGMGIAENIENATAIVSNISTSLTAFQNVRHAADKLDNLVRARGNIPVYPR